MAAALGAFVPDTAVRWRGVVAGDVARRLGVAAEARALAGRLERAGASARDAMTRRGRAHVEAHFSLEGMVGDTLAVYADLLANCP